MAQSEAEKQAAGQAVQAGKPVLRLVLGGSADADAPVRDAAAEGGLPITLRVAASVLVKGIHVTLPGVRWVVDLPTEAAVTEFYTALDVHIRDWAREQQ